MARALVAAAVALAVSCGAELPDDGQEPGAPGAVVSFETLLRTSHSGVENPLREVVRDEERWAQLWAVIHRDVSPVPPLPPTDFSRHMLIVVGAGARGSGGFDIAIRAVALHGDTLEVEVLETCPAPGDMVTGALTQPVEIVRLERLPHTPGFHDARSPSCPSE